MNRVQSDWYYGTISGEGYGDDVTWAIVAPGFGERAFNLFRSAAQYGDQDFDAVLALRRLLNDLDEGVSGDVYVAQASSEVITDGTIEYGYDDWE